MVNYFSGTPFDELQFEHIEALVAQQIPENLTLDYKQDLSRDSRNKKPIASELGKDVSSFANTFGGLLIYGVETDQADEPKPLEDNPIVGVEDKPELKMQIENMIISSISPSLYFRLKKIPMPNEENRCIIVIYVPQSYSAVHMVTAKNEMRFYKRFNFQSVPMDPTEIALRFQQIAQAEQAARNSVRRIRSETTRGPAFREGHYLGIYIVPRFPQPGYFNDPEKTRDMLDNSESHRDFRGGYNLERRANRFMKSGYREDLVLSFYYDGPMALSFSLARLWPDRVNASATYMWAYWFLDLARRRYNTFEYGGFLDVSMELRGLLGRRLVFEGSKNMYFREDRPSELTEEIEPYEETIEASDLVTARAAIPQRLIRPLFWSLDFNEAIGCWEDDGTPKAK